MNPITYLSAQYTVTHQDLVKFGIDMTKSASQVANKVSTIGNVQSLIGLFNMPQIVNIGNVSRIIKIKRKRVFKNKKKFYEVEVDRDTGYFIEPDPAFSDIMKFDPKTFEEEDEKSLQDVGYWNTLNKYVKPKSNH